VLSRFGAHSFATTGAITVRPGFHRVPDVVQVAGDWSSFGVWTCLGHLTHSRVETSNLDIGSGQPDESLATMLAAIPPTGELVLDVTPMPDQFPNLAIVAAHRAGRTRFVGGANLRLKECDRIAVMARELTRAGAAVEERPDGMVVHGGRPLRPIVVDPANDHRIAIAWALAGMLSPGISIAQPDCVAKSYPGFWNDLDAVVRMRRCVAVVGMRGAGKSTFGRAFAEHTGAAFCDTDEMFVQQHGPIAAFVADQGWPAFRREEARVVEAAVRAGRIVGLGGGAIETAATRELLREQTVVVWLDADADLLRARLQADPRVRPSVTGAPVLEEIETLLVRRTPLFAELATVRLDATLPTAQQVEQALRELGRSCRWPSDTRPA
jgi:shikimate kinase